MRTRLLTVAAAAILAVPLLSPAAFATSSDAKCDDSTSVEHKCENGKD